MELYIAVKCKNIYRVHNGVTNYGTVLRKGAVKQDFECASVYYILQF